MAANNQMWTKDYLVSKGYKPEDVTWDSANKTVKVNGMNFLSSPTLQGGKSYASQPQLDAAYNNLQTTQREADKNSYKSRINDYLNKEPAAYQAPAAFAYNAQSDPQYQAALRQAQQNAQTASNNALVGLASRGIGNSSIAQNAALQLQQKEYGRVSDTVLPQLMEQAYNRYNNDRNFGYQQFQDQYNMGRDRLGDYQTMYNNLSAEEQQALDNAFRNKQQNIDTALSYGDRTGNVLRPMDSVDNLLAQLSTAPKTLDRQGMEFNQAANTRDFNRGVLESDRGYNRGALESDRSYNLDNRQVSNSIANSNADNSRANSSAEQNRLMDIWKATGQAPEGLQGVAPGTPYGGQSTEPAVVDKKTSTDNYYQAQDNIKSGKGASRSSARQYAAAIRDQLSDSDYAKILNWIDKNYTK